MMCLGAKDCCAMCLSAMCLSKKYLSAKYLCAKYLCAKYLSAKYLCTKLCTKYLCAKCESVRAARGVVQAVASATPPSFGHWLCGCGTSVKLQPAACSWEPPLALRPRGKAARARRLRARLGAWCAHLQSRAPGPHPASM